MISAVDLLGLHPDLRWDFVNAEQAIQVRFDHVVTETFILSVPLDRIQLPPGGVELRQVQPDRGTIKLEWPFGDHSSIAAAASFADQASRFVTGSA